jgi:hypothetical protein
LEPFLRKIIFTKQVDNLSGYNRSIGNSLYLLFPALGAVRKTSVFLALGNWVNYDGANSKKTRQVKQGKVAIAILGFLISEYDP